MPKHPNHPSEDELLQSFLDRCRALMAEHGHVVQSVFGSDVLPPWAYTVGLSNAGRAELVVIGLPAETATYALNGVARRLAAEKIPDQADIHQVVNMPLRLRTLSLDAAWPHMSVARTLLTTPPREIRQVLWPDPTGRFPGDPSYRYAISQDLSELNPNPKRH